MTRSAASSTSSPAYGPPASVMRPSWPMAWTDSSPCVRPMSKSVRSCAGVIFRAPVPNSGSTRSSATILSSRPSSGRTAVLPTTSLYLSSSGCTATAVSPSIVSGRVVAMVTLPPPCTS